MVSLGAITLVDDYFVEEESLRRLADLVASNGGHHIQVFGHPSALKIDPRLAGKIIKDAGLEASFCTVVTKDDGDPLSDSKDLRIKAEQCLFKSIDAAAKMGAKIVAGPLLWVLGKTDYPQNLTVFKRMISFSCKATAYAGERGITLAVEWLSSPEGNVLTSTADAFALLALAGHPNLKLLVDSFHMAEMNEDISAAQAFLETRPEAIVCFHASGGGRQIPGNDQKQVRSVNWKAFNSLVAKAAEDRKVYLTIETFGPRCREFLQEAARKFPPAGTPNEIVSQGFAFLRGQLGKLVMEPVSF